MTITLVDHIGFNQHKVLAFLKDETLTNVAKLLAGNYAVIGGTAVVLYSSKAVRQVSPDIDILVNSAGMSIVKSTYKVQPNRFGFSTEIDNLEFDFLLARSRMEQKALANAAPMVVSGVSLHVVPVRYLIAIKYLLGRDKDLADLLVLYKKWPKAFAAAQLLINQQAPLQSEDFESEILLLKHQASI